MGLSALESEYVYPMMGALGKFLGFWRKKTTISLRHPEAGGNGLLYARLKKHKKRRHQPNMQRVLGITWASSALAALAWEGST